MRLVIWYAIAPIKTPLQWYFLRWKAINWHRISLSMCSWCYWRWTSIGLKNGFRANSSWAIGLTNNGPVLQTHICIIIMRRAATDLLYLVMAEIINYIHSVINHLRPSKPPLNLGLQGVIMLNKELYYVTNFLRLLIRRCMENVCCIVEQKNGSV